MTGTVAHVAFSRDDRRFLATHVTYDDGEARLGYRIWDTADWTLLRPVAPTRATTQAVATGTVGDAGFVAVYADDGYIEMRDLESDAVLWSVPMIPPQFAHWASGAVAPDLALVAIAPNGELVMGYERPRGGTSVTDIDHGGLVVRRTVDGSIVAVYEVPFLQHFAIAPDSKTFVYPTRPDKPLGHLALVHVPE